MFPALVHVPQGTKMPSIAYYRNYGKTFKKPRRPFEKERLDAELKVRGAAGPLPSADDLVGGWESMR